MAPTREISYSEIDAYQQCRLKHRLGTIEHWEPSDQRGKSPALSRGTAMHAMLEVHYLALKEGKGIAAAMTHALGALQREVDSGALRPEDQELLDWMYSGYTQLYGWDPDWEILAVEWPLREWLPTPRGTRSSFRLNGKIDLVVRERSTGRRWLVDHKTGARLPSDKDLDFSDQFKLYVYLLDRRGVKVAGIIYNALRTQRNQKPMGMDERFSRKLVSVSRREQETLANEAYRLMREAYATGGKGPLPPRSMDPDRCSWRCPFPEPCLALRRNAQRKSGDHETLLRDFGFQVGEPRYGS